MAISYTHQRNNVPAPMAQMVGGPMDDLIVKLWSAIHRLEEEVKEERTRNQTLTREVDNLTQRLVASSALEVSLTDMTPSPPQTTAAVSGSLETFPKQGVPLWHVLHALNGVHESRVFTVRKIQKLGFESPQKLHEYFSLWGGVSNLLVLHRQAKTNADQAGSDENVRIRPPSVGFVVMDDPAVVDRILATLQHSIGGHSCDVQVFQHKHRHSESSSDAEALPAFLADLRQGSTCAQAELTLTSPFEMVPGQEVAPFEGGFETLW